MIRLSNYDGEQFDADAYYHTYDDGSDWDDDNDVYEIYANDGSRISSINMLLDVDNISLSTQEDEFMQNNDYCIKIYDYQDFQQDISIKKIQTLQDLKDRILLDLLSEGLQTLNVGFDTSSNINDLIKHDSPFQIKINNTTREETIEFLKYALETLQKGHLNCSMHNHGDEYFQSLWIASDIARRVKSKLVFDKTIK